MKWYVLLAHPNPGSFNHALCNAFLNGLKKAGAVYTLNDLYASNFKPLMAGDDFNQFGDSGDLPGDVLAEQEKVDSVDALAFIYPVWWNEAPAILKGWFDRVLSKGWAYDISATGEFKALLKLEKVVILNTADNPLELLEDIGLNQAARLTKAEGTFLFCGAAEIDHRVLGDVSSDDEGRRRFLREVEALGASG